MTDEVQHLPGLTRTKQRHIHFCPEAYAGESYVIDAGYYYDTPFADLEGPFGTFDEAYAALIRFAESL